MGNWRERIPKGAKCERRDWVYWPNQSFQAGTLRNWDDEEIYFLATKRGQKALLMAMTLDEAAAICGVLSKAVMTVLWDKAGQEYEKA